MAAGWQHVGGLCVCRVIAVVRQEEQEEKVQLEQHVADWKQKQAAAAVEESRLRAARRQRVERLKVRCCASDAQRFLFCA